METNKELLLQLKELTTEIKRDIELLASSQNTVIDKYENIMGVYDTLLDSVTDAKDKEATQRYKRRELWVKLALALLNIFSLWLGNQLPNMLGG